MAATFTPQLNDPISRVRFRIGDTDTANPEIQDESITYYLGQGKTELRTAAILARSIASKYAKYADLNVDDQLTKYSQVYKNWVSVAEHLEAQADEEQITPAAPVSAYGGVIVTGLCDTRGPLDGPYPGKYEC